MALDLSSDFKVVLTVGVLRKAKVSNSLSHIKSGKQDILFHYRNRDNRPCQFQLKIRKYLSRLHQKIFKRNT